MDIHGAVDTSFADRGTLDYGRYFSRTIVASNDEVWSVGATSAGIGSREQFTLRRFDSNGSAIGQLVPDAELLRDGGAGATPEWFSSNAVDMIAAGAGVIAAGMTHNSDVETRCNGRGFVVRFRADGTLDPAFGAAGSFKMPFSACIVRVAYARNGGVYVVGGYDTDSTATFMLKLTASGHLDASFGIGGRIDAALAKVRPVERPDGRIVVGGAGFTVLRFLPNGQSDPTWGESGVVINRTPRVLHLQDFALSEDGAIVIVGAEPLGVEEVGGYANFQFRTVVVGYDANGALDRRFGAEGMTELLAITNFGAATPFELATIAPTPVGDWLVALADSPGPGSRNPSLSVYLLHGDEDSGRRPVTEYFHAGLDHYFYTADPTEIAILDQGTIPGWTRTGESFNAYANLPGDASPVCRFFSTLFAPKSSHFYTGNVAECAAVGAMPAWTREGVVFALPLPDANGACPFGTRRVYRAYNNGMGGAPAHRLTTNVNTRYAMESAGWIREGNGFDGVTLCAPN